jgi:hypothetical protein
MKRILTSGLLLALLLAGASPRPLDSQGAPRIVAVGDIHGAVAEFKSILKTTGLADDTGRWSGGRAILVQTGDYMDRGAGTRPVLDLLMALERQATDAGGRVFVMLGNHEVMNLIGDTRDATPEIFATFADAQSESRRVAAWDRYAQLARTSAAKGEAVPAVYQQSRDAFLAAHPPGYLEYREAIGPRGQYGAWLRSKPIVIVYAGSIFMHAGIEPTLAPAKLEDLNDRVRDEVRRIDRFVQRLVDAKLALPFFTLEEILQVAANEIRVANATIVAVKEGRQEQDGSRLDVPLLTEAQEILNIEQWTVVNPERELWYRGFATLPDDPAGAPFALLLERYRAKRFVTGHTPQEDRRITVRYGGRVILIDTGMLTGYYKGRASALEIDGERLSAIYADARVPIAVR